MEEKTSKKYEFTGETRELNYSYDGSLKPGGTVLLHRIRALRYISDVDIYEDDEGGWIESEENLSQDGNCWVCDDACVFGNAVVKDNACACDNAVVKGHAVICDNGIVMGNAKVGGNAVVSENASVEDDSRVYACVTLSGSVQVKGTADISENIMQNRDKVRATISGDFTVQGYIGYDYDGFGSGYSSLLAGDDDIWADEDDDNSFLDGDDDDLWENDEDLEDEDDE